MATVSTQQEKFGFSTFIPAIRIPQPNGGVLVKAGQPVIKSGQDEVGTAQFAKLVGLSQRQVQTLVDQGHIKARRPGHPRGKFLIPVAELTKRLKPI